MQHLSSEEAPSPVRSIAALLAFLVAMALPFSAPAAHAQTAREKATLYHGLATKVLTTPPYKVYQDAAITYVTDIQKQQFKDIQDSKPIWSDAKIYNQVSLFLVEAATIAQIEIFDEIEKVVPYEEAVPLLARWRQPEESKALACLVVLPVAERQSTGVAKCNRDHGAGLTAQDEAAVGRIGDAISAGFAMPKTNAAINGAICLTVDKLTKEMSVDGVTYTLKLELGLSGSPQLPCDTVKLRWAGLVGLGRVMELESSMAPAAPQ